MKNWLDTFAPDFNEEIYNQKLDKCEEFVKSLVKYPGKYNKATYGEDGQNEPNNFTINNSNGSLYIFADGRISGDVVISNRKLIRLLTSLKNKCKRRAFRGKKWIEVEYDPDNTETVINFIEEFTKGA